MSKLHKVSHGGRFQMLLNVEYQLKDKNGKVKPMFQDNKLGKFLLNTFRKFITNPINEAGQVKDGFFNHLAAYGVRINGLTGNWTNTMVITNTITDTGRAAAASRLGGAGSEALFDKIGQGTGVAAAAASDTALGAEKDASGGASTTHAISAATQSRVTTTVTNDTAQSVGTISEAATIAVTESGLFNAATGGVMLCRQTFSAVNVVNGDSLQITWKIKFA